MKDIKSKPKNVRSNTYKLKTADAAKPKAAIPMSAVDSLKRQYVKSKTELQKQTSEQTERPENYAVDEVEDKAESAAYAAADTMRQSARYVKNKIQQHRAARVSDTPVPDIPAQETVQPQMLNAPKTATLQTENKPVPQEQMKIKARQKAAANQAKIKTKDATLSDAPKHTAENIPKTKAAQEQMRVKAKQHAVIKSKDTVLSAEAPKGSPEPILKIKRKSEYMKNKSAVGERNYRLKSDKVYKSKAQMIKPKTLQEVRAKQEAQRLNPSDNKNQTARKYVQNKLKTKAELQKTVEISNTDIQPISGNPVQTETHITPKQKSTPQEQIKVKKAEIKTKDSYIRSHARSMMDITAKSSGIDGNPHIISQDKRSIKYKPKNTIKSVPEKSSTFKSVRKTRMPKTAQRTVKKSAKKAAVKTQKQIKKQAAKQAAKRAKELAQRSMKAAKAAAKATVKVAVKVAKAVVAAAKAIISAIASGGAVAVVVVALIVVIIIAAIVASPFGITISEEVNDAGTIPLSQIIAEYNVELTQETEDIELSVEHTEVEVIDNRTDNNIVIAVFAAKLAGAEDNTAEDVVVFDDVKAEKLKSFFRAANTVSHTVEETTEGEETKKKLTITVSGKTKDELMDEYSLTARQREAVEILLENGDILTSSSHSLAITDANVQSIINGLPSSLPQKRKDVVKNAGSLVGKVNYFWGGKSSAIGWDSAWGTMQRVTAAGSPSSGTVRAYGLDCSGFVTWAFNNSGMYVGDGTIGQRDRSTLVSASTVQAGDLAFLSSYSHVGIVVGKDTSGNILVIHCSSSANNVVLSTASSVGFTVFRRPNCY